MTKKIVRYLDQFFTWLYGSEYNPLHRSGSLLVGLLLLVLISGFYLIFFYRVGAPYESLQGIQDQWYLGRWIRAFHRYTSDIAAIMIFYHMLAMFSQGKSWGPRTLAWVSGVILLGAFFVSGWTGYVMVWDHHGQKLAQEGARILQTIPFLHDDLAAAFSGQINLSSSFFFMNLFLHVAIPLGMVFGLWLHTSKMAKIQFFPERKLFINLTVSLIIFSIFFSAPLLSKGNLLEVVGRIPVDIWFSFLIPLNSTLSPLFTLLIFIVSLTFLISVVFWSQPKKNSQVVSSTLKSGPIPSGDDFQLTVAKNFAEAHPNSDAYIILGCTANFESSSHFEEIINNNFISKIPVVCYPSGCGGQLHNSVITFFLEKYRGVFIWTCPPRACENKENPKLLRAKLQSLSSLKNIPEKSRNRVYVVNYSSFETELCVEAFNSYVSGEEFVAKKDFNLMNVLKPIIASTTILLSVIFGSQIPWGNNTSFSVIRFNFMLPNLKLENCHTPTETESKGQLSHMTYLKKCDEIFLSHQILIKLNDTIVLDKTIDKKNKEMQILKVFHESQAIPGVNNVEILITSKDDKGIEIDTQTLNESYDLSVGKVKLIQFKEKFF